MQIYVYALKYVYVYQSAWIIYIHLIYQVFRTVKFTVYYVQKNMCY